MPAKEPDSFVMTLFKEHTRLLRRIALVALGYLSVYAHAQHNDSIRLNEVVVYSYRLERFSTGIKIVKVDSSLLQNAKYNNLAALLAQDNGLFVKSYGQGSLATTSIRGAGAAHTALLWNGFNINSPMLGQLDLSLIPVNFIDNAAIQYGGSGSLWGSGSVGGNIILNNDKQFGKGLSVGIGSSLASFGTSQQNADVTISTKKLVSSTRAFYRKAENDFIFYNSSTGENLAQKQTHAGLIQYGVLQENYFRINSYQKINFRFWYQNSDRDIPPTMLQMQSKASQQDYFYRASTEWQRTGDKITWFLRSGYFNDFLNYSDKASGLYSPSRSLSWISEGETRIRISAMHELNAGINNTYARAYTSAYKENRSQNRTALFSSYRFTSKDKSWNIAASARQEFVKDKTIPVVGSIGSEWKFMKFFMLKGNINKVFRLPTLNDLYWNPGGNRNLLPENGYSEDAGLNTVVHFKRAEFQSDLTVFNRNIENWIIWLPGAGGIWSPKNIASVWSRGMETRWGLKFAIKKASIKTGLTTSYVVSTNQKAKTEGDESVGRQLIYVPMYSGAGNISIEYKKFYFSYNHTYTGYRYTSTDNYEYLLPYMLGNVQCGYRFSIKNYMLKLSGQANNIWNAHYQVISQQAMPLLNYQLALSLNFNKPNKQ